MKTPQVHSVQSPVPTTAPNACRLACVWFGGLAFVLVNATALTGCTSQAKAKEQAKAAYLAGQQEGMFRMQQARTPTVTIIGHVRNPMVTWTPDMTLAKAILAAGYLDSHDPTQILIVRNGQAVPVEPKQLLSGEDVPLQSGDMIQLK